MAHIVRAISAETVSRHSKKSAHSLMMSTTEQQQTFNVGDVWHEGCGRVADTARGEGALLKNWGYSFGTNGTAYNLQDTAVLAET